jgi:hypothetical protein
MKTASIRSLLLVLFLVAWHPPLLHAAVTGRSEDSSLAGTEKLLSDSSGTDTFITVSTLNAAQTYTAGLTASGSSAWDFSGSTGTFLTSSGLNTFGGSGHAFASILYPSTNDGASLGNATYSFSDLFLASGAVINFHNANVLLTHSADVLTVTNGDLRVTTAGTNAASAVTVGGTQTLAAKTLTSPVISAGLTASGSAANTFAASSGTFITSTGINTFKGSAHNFDAVLQPTTNDAAALGTTSLGFSDLHLASGAVINVANGNAVITHSSGIFTVSTGDLRVTTAGTNAASAVTVGGTQTLTNKTLTTPVLGVATATSINKVTLTAPASGSTLTIADGKTLTASNTLTLAGTDGTTMTFPSASGTVITSSLSTNAVSAANAIWGASNALVLEGATADAHETSITPADATADRTVTLADASGTVMLSSLATNAPDAANSVTGASNALVLEGATANTSELSVTLADPTADRTVTLADASGTVMLSSLATNAPDAANSVTGASNGLVLEGATADAHETTITPTDATADRTVTVPNASGTVHLAQSSTAVSLTADNQAVTPGSATVIQLSSDNATDTNRTFTLSATGAITGQIYVLIGPATNACEIADTGIQRLSGTWSAATADTLTLLFDGTNFNEIARSNN